MSFFKRLSGLHGLVDPDSPAGDDDRDEDDHLDTVHSRALKAGAFGLAPSTPAIVVPLAKTSTGATPTSPHLFAQVSDASHRPQLTETIKESGKFPGWLSVLSGPAANGALNVPPELQDKLLAVKLTSGRVVIAYDPSDIAELKSRRSLMRSELSDAGHTVDAHNLPVIAGVLKEIRVAAEKKAHQGAGEIRSAAVSQFREWIEQAKALGATDVHLRIRGGGRGDVMVRVDGDLEHLPDSKAGLTNNQVLTCIKAAYEALADRHSNSDGMFSDLEPRSCIIDSQLGIPNLRLRFNSLQGHYGPMAVLRLLTTSVDHKPMSFESMGFAPSQVALLQKAQRMEKGLMIQCGIPGSGKTTVAKTFLETHPKNGVGAFYQVADPVEYLIRGVHQIDVQRSIATLTQVGKKDPYSQIIESILRMDPDALDVGEVRDIVSASAVAVAAKSGQIALGTLHTGSIMGIMGRLTDDKIGLSRGELTSGKILGLLTYQALVAKLCPHCALEEKEALRRLDTLGDRRAHAYLGFVVKTLREQLKVDVAGLKFRNHEGCSACRERGTQGQTIVAEMMIPDEEWLDLSALGKDRAAWRQYQDRYSDGDLASGDMTGKSVFEHAVYKALQGQIDPTGVERFDLFENYQSAPPQRSGVAQ